MSAPAPELTLSAAPSRERHRRLRRFEAETYSSEMYRTKFQDLRHFEAGLTLINSPRSATVR